MPRVTSATPVAPRTQRDVLPVKGRLSRRSDIVVLVDGATVVVVVVVVDTVDVGPAVVEVAPGTVVLLVEEVEVDDDVVLDAMVLDDVVDDVLELDVDELDVVVPCTTKHAPPALRFSLEPAVLPPVSFA
jgi:hypothetical protein